MFTFFCICSGFIAFVHFIFCGGCQFRDISLVSSLVIWFLMSIIFGELASSKKLIKQQQDKIERIETHLAIKDDDPVNQNNDNKND